MLTVEEMENQLISVKNEGEFTHRLWNEYQVIVMNLLDSAERPLYILSDFTETTGFEKTILPHIGSDLHFSHPKLGLIVLVGGSVLINFLLVVAENRATKEQQSQKMRVSRDRNEAVKTLRHYRDIAGIAP